MNIGKNKGGLLNGANTFLSPQEILAKLKGLEESIKNTLPSVSATDNGKLLGVDDGKWETVEPPKELPTVSNTDNGKVLGVGNGTWGVMDVPKELPTVSGTDDGKLLGVDNGQWGAVNLPSGVFSITHTELPAEERGVLNKTAGEIIEAFNSGKICIINADFGTTEAQYLVLEWSTQSVDDTTTYVIHVRNFQYIAVGLDEYPYIRYD